MGVSVYTHTYITCGCKCMQHIYQYLICDLKEINIIVISLQMTLL